MTTDTSDFANELQALLAREAAAAHGDTDRMGAMLELVACGLGFSAAIAARGNPAAINELLEGATHYATTEAAHRAPFARMMK